MACGSSSDTETTEDDMSGAPVPNIPEAAPPHAKNNIIGYYVGSFEAEKYKENKMPSYSNRINISIDEIKDGKVLGHSVVAGNMRPFEGTITQSGDIYRAEVKEPGDDRYDGVFSFTVDVSKNTMIGNWIANDTKLAVSERIYQLDKKVFKYNPNLEIPEYIWEAELYNTYNEKTGDSEYPTEDASKFNASTTLLTKKDVENMYKADLEIIRNTIYARHGYSFKNRRMRYIFDSNVDWYIPVKVDILADLTDLEKKNIDLLKRYEEHATAYYDSFGR